MKQNPVSDLEASSVRDRRESTGECADRPRGDGVAHELKNLLTIVLGYANWLEAREGLDPQIAEAARIIHGASKSASVLLGQLLAAPGLAAPALAAPVLAAPEEPARTDDASPLFHYPGGDEWILVVEDDARLRSLAEQILAMRGYHVLGAANAKEALALVDTHGPKLSLLLSDVIMPGANGRELAKRALKKCPGLSVIYMSGYTDASAVQDGSDTPQAFLGKPFTAIGLLELVRSTLDAARARADATADASAKASTSVTAAKSR